MLPDNYAVYRRDRTSDDHGGVLFACKKDIIVTERKDLEEGSEIVWHQLELSGRRSLLLGTVYKPKHNDIVTVNNLERSMNSINRKSPKSDVLICGDFNQSNIDWENLIVKIPSNACTKTATKLLDFTIEHGLEQLVKKPTRGENILDLVLTNNVNLVIGVSVEPGLSDHSIVKVNLDLKLKRRKPNRRKVYLRHKADETGIKNDIFNFQVKYAEEMGQASVQEKWDAIEKEIKATMDRHVPSKMSSHRHDLPWFDRRHRRLTRTKKEAL